MRTANVTFKRLTTSGFDGVEFLLRVETASRGRYVRLQGSEELSFDKPEFRSNADLFQQTVLMEGLQRLRAEIDTQGLDTFMQGSDPYRLLLAPATMPDRLSVPQKRCAYQKRTPQAMICQVGDLNPPIRLRPANTTTVPVCRECHHPDDRFRCSELVSVWTEAGRVGDGELQRIAYGLCALGYEVAPNAFAPAGHSPAPDHDISRCRLGARDCARVIWEFEDTAEPRPDVGHHLLREIDYLQLVARAEVGLDPIALPDAQTVGLLLSDAPSAAEFTQCIAAAATILEKMRWPKGAPEPGSINALEHYLASIGAAISKQNIRVLRAVVDLRHGPPLHDAADKALRGATTLGLSYPITDHKQAWQRIRQALADALNAVSLAIKQRPQTEKA